MGKMRRDAKGRFTKALAKVRSQPTTDEKLERKLVRIEQVQRQLSLARLALAFNALFIVGCGALVAAGPLVGSIPIGTAGVLGLFWRATDFRDSGYQYLRYRATHQRLLKGADNLTNKLLVEENVISPPESG